MTLIIELSAPHNWCDRRCERCPLSTSCPVPSLPDRKADELLSEAVDLLGALCRQQGIGLTEETDPTPPTESLDARLLREAGHRWAETFAALHPTVADALTRGVFVAGKVVRIASQEDLGDDELWSYDTLPNLLVVERVLTRAGTDVDRARARLPAEALIRFDEAHALLRGLLAPLLDAVSASERFVFAALAAAGQAPSPLATR